MMEMKNRSHGHSIDSPKSRHVINISIMSRYEDTYIYKATPKQHLKLNSCEGYSEAVLKRRASDKKACISLVPRMTPSVGVKACLIYLFWFRRAFEVVFCVNHEKFSFSCPDFEPCEILI